MEKWLTFAGSGPVGRSLSAHSARTANATDHGLAASVRTEDPSRAHRMIRAVKSGLAHIDACGGSVLAAPLSGARVLGAAHDKSQRALDQHLHLKTARITP